MAATHFSVDYDKRGMASCKSCKQKFGKGELRVAKLVPNPFSESGSNDMKNNFHPDCFFQSMKRSRATSNFPETSEDFEGWADLGDADKNLLKQKLKELEEVVRSKKERASPSPAKKKRASVRTVDVPSGEGHSRQTTVVEAFGKSKKTAAGVETSPSKPGKRSISADGDSCSSWSAFIDLCQSVAKASSYNRKTEIIKEFLLDETSRGRFRRDLLLFCKLLMPGVAGVDDRVYHINSKRLISSFATIFTINQKEMMQDLDNIGDVSQTVKNFFQQNKNIPPQAESTLSLLEVDTWLDRMATFSTESDQQAHLRSIAQKCTADDLQWIIRQLKKDLRINAGAKHVMDALDQNAYSAFQASRDLESVISKAQPCRSAEEAVKRCPNGMYAEIKYDGERVQVHKSGLKYWYFSRSLKPVQEHKVGHLKNFIPKAFPADVDLVLDAEVLLIDTSTKKPLPFGSLGKHKKNNFKMANVCLFVFDCLYYNGQSLLAWPLRERRKTLLESMTEIPNHVHLSEMKLIKEKLPLKKEIERTIQEGLEGLVLKDTEGIYEPGKRHWLKVKKDYLEEGQMADSADLIVLGAYYGTGNKGGIMSVFLMGCYDSNKKKFCTVTKCGNGHSDDALKQINKELKNHVTAIHKDFTKVPPWLCVSRQLVPDFVKAPVWEIVGAEFSKSEAHTADGISIRFPRVTKVRDDKSWDTATNLDELKNLYAISKQHQTLTTTAVDEEEAADDEDLAEELDDAAQPSTSRAARTSPKKQRRDAESSPTTPSPNKGRSVHNTKTAEKHLSPKTSRSRCKYGGKCYQKNPNHRSQFWHPGDPEEEGEAEEESADSAGDEKETQSKRRKAKTAEADSGHESAEDQIPSLFSGMQFHWLCDSEMPKDVRRNIAYFDGDVVDDLHAELATHIVVDKSTDKIDKKKIPSTATIVTKKWLSDCIQKRKVLPIRS